MPKSFLESKDEPVRRLSKGRLIEFSESIMMRKVERVTGDDMMRRLTKRRMYDYVIGRSELLSEGRMYDYVIGRSELLPEGKTLYMSSSSSSFCLCADT